MIFILGDYRDVTQEPLPFKKLGFPNLDEFINSIPDVVRVRRYVMLFIHNAKFAIIINLMVNLFKGKIYPKVKVFLINSFFLYCIIFLILAQIDRNVNLGRGGGVKEKCGFTL